MTVEIKPKSTAATGQTTQLAPHASKLKLHTKYTAVAISQYTEDTVSFILSARFFTSVALPERCNLSIHSFCTPACTNSATPTATIISSTPSIFHKRRDEQRYRRKHAKTNAYDEIRRKRTPCLRL